MRAALEASPRQQTVNPHSTKGISMNARALTARFALAAITAGLSAGAHAHSEECRATTDAEIAALFDRWNAALATGEPAKVVANYATESILLPTVSNKPRLTPADKLDYFEMFLKLKPQGKIDMRTVQVGCNSALDAGIYTFTLGDGRKVQARYTYTYKWDGSQWLITSHHSSAMLEKS
jgi:uncharacterized protein (TIGR02246 family)